jgi:hypothetical protein
VLRFLKVLRPLKALRYFKGILVFIESLSLSASILLITTVMFLIAMVAIAFITSGTIGDSLTYRCVPPFETINGVQELYANSSARADPNYQTYGYAYFESAYNLAYCKNDASCPSDHLCQRLHVPVFEVHFTAVNVIYTYIYIHIYIPASVTKRYKKISNICINVYIQGVPGDYSSPWAAFKTNLSFVTLRGWPLVFSAINVVYGPSLAYFVLALTVLVCPLFILNMFPAIFIISLKRCEDLQLRMDWLKHFPGNKVCVCLYVFLCILLYV